MAVAFGTPYRTMDNVKCGSRIVRLCNNVKMICAFPNLIVEHYWVHFGNPIIMVHIMTPLISLVDMTQNM